MTVTFQLPPNIEEQLRHDVGDLNAAAKEAVLVEFYRQGKLTHYQLATALGLDRYQADGVLKRHGVCYEISHEELRDQLQSLSPGSGT